MEDNLLNIHFRKAPANRTVCVSVVDRVNALEVPNASLVLSARHSTFTVTAADESLERIVMLFARGIPSSASNDLLSKLKVFLADNGFMRSFYDNRFIDNALFRADTAGLHFAADQCSGVNKVLENVVDHHGFPTDFLAHVTEFFLVGMLALEVLPRCWDAVIVQAAGNLRGVAAFQSLAEDTHDHISRLRVYGKFIPNGRMQDVAVWSIAADILALLHHLDFCRCGLYGEVFAVCRIDDAAHNHFQTSRCAFVIVAVIAVVDGNKADAHERKGALQIVSRFDVVTRKTGKVFDADQIDLAALDLLHHLRELRTAKVRAGITVIRKLRPLTARQLWMIVKKAIDEHTLVADAVTFRLAAIAGIFISH